MHKCRAGFGLPTLITCALSGFAYTAFFVDVFSRKVVGVVTRSTMRTDALFIKAKALEHVLTTAG